MLGGKAIAVIFCRKCIAGVERKPKRGRVRLDQDVGNGDLVLEVGPLTDVMRILVAADIKPWPAVERALLHAGDVVRNEIVAKAVTLVGRAIDVAGGRMNREPHAISDPGGK